MSTRQHVLGAWSPAENISDRINGWIHPLLIPPYVAAVSVCVLFGQILYSELRSREKVGQLVEEAVSTDEETLALRSRMKGRIAQSGGFAVFSLNSIRLLSCLALASLTMVSSILSGDRFSPIPLFLHYVYAIFLAAATLSTRYHLVKLATVHLVVVLAVPCVLFWYRDIWPLMTYTLKPQDDTQNGILWAKISILSFAAVVVPLVIPRVSVPTKEYKGILSQKLTVSTSPCLLSLLMYSYLDRLVFKAYQNNKLRSDDLPPLSAQSQTKTLVTRGYKHVDPLRSGKRRHIITSLIFKVFLLDHIEMALALLVHVFLSFAAPFGINRLLNYLENHGEGAVVRPWVWVLWLFFGPFFSSVSNQWFYFAFVRTVVQSQNLVTQLIFDHALRIRVKAETASATSDSSPGNKKGGSNFLGKINNMITSDMGAMMSGRNLVMLVCWAPMQLAASMVALYSILGWSVFPGVAVMAIMVPIPGYCTKLLRGIQVKRMKKSDARVQAVTETMNVIRMIKLLGWETKISDQISEKRQEELVYIRKFKLLEGVTTILTALIPIMTMVVTYTTFTLVMKRELTASLVFPSMAIFELVQEQFNNIFSMLPLLVQAKVSLDRIDGFLHETELLDEYSATQDIVLSHTASSLRDPETDEERIGIKSASFTWSTDRTPSNAPDTTQRSFVLTIEDLFFQKGRINLLVGQTGSGKTAVLLALLGEMHYKPMNNNSRVLLPRRNGVAYHAQEPWVLNDTIRDNILFGAAYDPQRYATVLDQCALNPDLESFDAGDLTEVGERGLTLSGGQKARISLARAVYSPAEILLLDDVLAALDVHTAQWVVDRCFKGELIRGRTVILVTHNIALASSIADFVVAMGVVGRVLSQGSLSAALASDEALSSEAAEEKKVIEMFEKQATATSLEKPKQAANGKLVLSEEKAVGHVGWSTVKLFLGSMSSKPALAIFYMSFFSSIALSKLTDTSQTWILGIWAGQYQEHPPSQVSVPFFLSIYCALILASFVTYLVGYTIYIFGTMRASNSVHKLLVDSILVATFRWLDRTPISRVIARCTQDISSIDGMVPMALYRLIDMTSQLFVKFIAIVIVSPIFALPGAVLATLGGWLGNIYMKAQLPVKRESNNARAPALGHLGASIAGLVSIRAYNAQDKFRDKFSTSVDKFARANVTFMNLNRWVTIRTDALSGLFTASLAAYLLYGTGVSASNIGFSLMMAVGFSNRLLWWVRYFNAFEVSGTSLERIHQYLTIEHESEPSTQGVPPAYWPASGELRVKNLSAQYSEDGPKILHNISFDVKSGERIGIVGRTGSGKSSLTLSLLRCIVTEGSVTLDGIDTGTINLDALRSKITIIPQVPELLRGTLRQNLDPFSQYSDATLNDALRAAGLFSLRTEDDQGHITLDTAISGGGNNLSVGQRQLVALARAIVRQSKLLILDEATSFVDYETDSVIQASLRKELGKDVTVLTIAHRLDTIMDADKIMVLDEGRIVEFASPSQLLTTRGSKFRDMVEKSNDRGRLLGLVKGLTPD